MWNRLAVAVLAGSLLFPAALAAQAPEAPAFLKDEVPALPAAPSTTPPAEWSQRAQTPDFLLRAPSMSIALRGGMLRNRGDSDIYDDIFQRLTLDRSDLHASTMGAELGIWFGDRIEGVLGLDVSRVTQRSEFRDWVEENGDPIEQFTKLRQGPAVTLGVKGYLLPRGESFGNFAWAPTRLNAYAGAGLGGMWYEFEQWGDFVDEEEAIIFTSRFSSNASTFVYYVNAGAEYGLSRRTSLVVEARQHWANGELGRDFQGFEPIDLSGLRFTAGLAFRF